MSSQEEIDQTRIPRHVAVIMDGNGRWAKSQGKNRIFGHRNALNAVHDTIEGCAELGVEYLTLYAFSTENWKRPRLEIQALMELLVNTIHKELPTLNKNRIRLMAIGDSQSLPSKCRRELKRAVESTASNDRMTLVLALSYSARWEILNATKRIAEEHREGRLDLDSLDEDSFKNYLTTASFPDPELMIRTSGEYRISNFLLWQMAYTELVFINKYWPDFRKDDLHEAIIDYQNRERRFGKISEQIKA